jgi:hypothetical protein
MCLVSKHGMVLDIDRFGLGSVEGWSEAEDWGMGWDWVG